jgi:hypothetical protein
MMVMAMAISPPPPTPWIPRAMTSWTMSWAIPANADPTRKVTMANWNTTRRPTRSLIFPYSGTEAVELSRYAVTTHDRCSMPPSSPTMVGSAVATMVWSRAARRMPSIRPE